MKNLTLASGIMIITLIMACNQPQTDKESKEHFKTEEVVQAMKNQQKAAKLKDGIFIHLSHGPEDPQRVLMALNMAKMMSETKNVLVYIDIKGVYTVLKDAEDIAFKEFPSSHQLLDSLKSNQVKVMVCPGCLKAAGKTPEDVMEWVKIADKESFFNFTDGRIISIDY